MRSRTLPAALRPDDVVTGVAPAARPNPAAPDAGVEALLRRGIRVKVADHALGRYGHLAGTDRDRAGDLMSAFLDPEVRGIFCARGGAGCSPLLPYLDLGEIAAHPKVFVGYSDVTILHLALSRHAGWPTFYGPMVAIEMARRLDECCFDALWRLITSPEPGGLLKIDDHPVRTLIGGAAEGILAGGTLCLLATSLGTPYAIQSSGTLLALEDVHETAWRVDRMLTHLQHAGALDGPRGFIVGSLSDPRGAEDASEELPIEQSLRDHLGRSDRPVVCGFPFGHIRSPLTLPFNCRARLDATAGALEVLEPAVA